MRPDKPSRWRNLLRTGPSGNGGGEDAEPAPASDPGLAEALERHERALTEAAAAAGSLCAIARSGESWPAVKYHEGAVVALRAVRRAGSASRQTASHMLDVWRRAQAEARDAGMAGDWTAYRAGGIDALSAYLDGSD